MDVAEAQTTALLSSVRSRSSSGATTAFLLNLPCFRALLRQMQGGGAAVSPNEIYISSISTFLNFVILRCQGAAVTPFETHPKTVTVAILSFLLLVCSMLAGAEARFRSASGNICVLIARSISFFWCLTMASIVSLLLPDSIRTFLYVLCLVPLFPELLRRNL